MNVELFKTLRSMKAIEDEDPHFRTRSYDFASLTLAHPESVIFVVSPTGKKPHPPLPPLRFVKNRIQDAVMLARYMAVHGWALKTSIVVHEGIYIDPFENYTSPQFRFGRKPMLKEMPAGFAVEIVGLGNVRIILETNQFHVSAGDWKLRNLSVFDFSERRLRYLDIRDSFFLTSFGESTKFEMEDVNVHAPKLNAVVVAGCRDGYVENEEMTVKCRLVRCNIYKCRHGVCGLRGSATEIVDSRFVEQIDSGLTGRETAFDVKKTTFVNAPLKFYMGEALFTDCVIDAGTTLCLDKCVMGQVQRTGLEGEAVRLSMTGTSITNFSRGLELKKSGTRAVLNRCSISDTYCAVLVMFNVRLTIADSDLHCAEMMKLNCCDTGKVELKRNRFVRGANPICLVDQLSKDPIHDMGSGLRILQTRFRDATPKSSAKSKHTKQARKGLKKAPAVLGQDDPRPHKLHKHCEKCGKQEGMSACNDCTEAELHFRAGLRDKDPAAVRECKCQQKFRYCSRCRRACYCSKECLEADWPDHRVVCGAVKDPGATDGTMERAIAEHNHIVHGVDCGSGIHVCHRC